MNPNSTAWPFSRVETTLRLDPCGDENAIKLSLMLLAGRGFSLVSSSCTEMLGARITLINLRSEAGDAVLQASLEDGVELICSRDIAATLGDLAIGSITSITTGTCG
ncbi:MAG: hypothetical protein RL095_3995 [Verrucomicrobiota bacterium]|jgi:hypothetical protein